MSRQMRATIILSVIEIYDDDSDYADDEGVD